MNYQKLIYVILNTLSTLQLVSLNWNSNKFNLQPYSLHWKILGYANFDRICADSNLLFECSIISTTLLLLLVLTLFIALLFIHLNREVPALMLFVSKKIMDFLSTVGFIPLSLLFTMILKYSIGNQNEIQGYSNVHSSNFSNRGLWIVISSVGVTILFSFSYLSIIASSDLRHTKVVDNLESKAHSKIDREMLCMSSVVIFVYTISINYNPLWYQIVLVLWPLRILYLVFSYVPYYNSLPNEILIARNLVIAVTTVIFILGDFINDTPLILLMF